MRPWDLRPQGLIDMSKLFMRTSDEIVVDPSP
jgi:hypothetical protein